MMKRILLSITVLMLAATIGMAQSTVKVDQKPLSVDAKELQFLPFEPNGGMTTGNPVNVMRGGPVTPTLIGSSSNVYGVIGGSDSRYTDASNRLNTITFLHRNNINVNGGFSGEYRLDLSTDNGDNWSVDQGVLNPSANDAPYRGRYPMGFIWNPNNAADPDSAYMIYLGAMHTGSTPWDGAMAGSWRLDGGTLDDNVLEPPTAYPGGFASVVPGSLVPAGMTGRFMAVDYLFDTSDVIGAKVLFFKGDWDSPSESTNWWMDTLDIGLDTSHAFSTPYVAFDSTGVNGWMLIPADLTTDAVDRYDLHMYSTTDTGSTWSLDTVIATNDIWAIDSVMFDTVIFTGPDTVGMYPIVWEGDLKVDHNGIVHFFTQVGHGSGFSIFFGVHRLLFDITYNPMTGDWNAEFVDTARTFGNTIFGGTGFWHYSRPMISMNDDRDAFFYFWADSDPAIDGSNTFPDVWGQSYDLVSMNRSESINFTSGTSKEAECHFPNVSRHALELPGGTCVPVVITTPGVTDLDPPEYYYIHNICFGAPTAEFTSTYSGYGGKVFFTDQSDNVPTSWAWTFDDPSSGSANTSSLQNPTHTFTADGTYNVCLTVSNSFGSDNVCHDVTVGRVGIEEAELNARVSLMPNPTTGFVTVTIGETAGQANVKVMNMIGAEMLTASQVLNGSTAIEMDLTGLANGIYFLEIDVEGTRVTKKITLAK
jgi:PKD repeat protein